MIAGFDKYMQIVRCFRDEDLRADRQLSLRRSTKCPLWIPKIYSLSMRGTFNGSSRTPRVEVEVPFIRMSFIEAMERFGSDK